MLALPLAIKNAGLVVSTNMYIYIYTWRESNKECTAAFVQWPLQGFLVM